MWKYCEAVHHMTMGIGSSKDNIANRPTGVGTILEFHHNSTSLKPEAQTTSRMTQGVGLLKTRTPHGRFPNYGL